MIARDNDRPRVQQMEDAVLPIAATALDAGQVETARRLYRRLLEVDPDSVQARMGLGDVALRELEAAAAARWYRAALGHAKEPPERHAALLAHARAALAAGQLEEARKSFRRLTVPKEQALRESVAWGYNGVGLTLLLEGDLTGAVAAMEQAVLRAPDEERFQGNLNRALVMRDAIASREEATPDLAGVDRSPRQNGEAFATAQPSAAEEPAPALATSGGPSSAQAQSGQAVHRAPEPDVVDRMSAPSNADDLRAIEIEPVEAPVRVPEPTEVEGSHPPMPATATELGADAVPVAAEAVAGPESREGGIEPVPSIEGEHFDGGAKTPSESVETEFSDTVVDDLALPSEHPDVLLAEAVAPAGAPLDGAEQGTANQSHTTGGLESDGLDGSAMADPEDTSDAGIDVVLQDTEPVELFIVEETILEPAQQPVDDAAPARPQEEPAFAGAIDPGLDAQTREHSDTDPNATLTAQPAGQQDSVELQASEVDWPNEDASGADHPLVVASSVNVVTESSLSVLQFGAFADLDNAETVAAHLRSLTDRTVALTDVADETGALLHRVRMGPFVSRNALLRVISTLEMHGYSIVNPPNPYIEGDSGAASGARPLETLMVQENGEDFLQAGAYSDRYAAEALASELRILTERPVRIGEVDNGDGQFLYRVRIGPLETNDPLIHLFAIEE